MTTITDFLETHVGTQIQIAGGLWVRMRNNDTAVDYYSVATSDPATGAFTITAPPGMYALYTGSVATVIGTPTLQTAYYAVPVTAGDDVVVKSLTGKSSSPYAPNLPGASSIPTPPGILTGTVWVYGGFAWNVRAANAKGDCQGVADGAMLSTSAILTSASNLFAAGDVGKSIAVVGAAAAGATALGTIASFQNAGQVTCSFTNASGGNISAKAVRWGTDDSATAIPNTITAAGIGGTVVFPAGNYCCATKGVQPLDRQALYGAGSGFTTITPIGPTAAGAGDGIRLAAAAGAAYFTGLALFDLIVDGICQSNPASGVTVSGVHNFVMERCQVKNATTYGLYYTSVSAGGVLGLGTQMQHGRIKDTYITASRTSDNFGGGGIIECIFDRCWSDTPITNGFDLTNMTDTWFHVCRVTATSGTPTGFASDFGSNGIHYIDCKVDGVGIQNGFAMTGDRLNAGSLGTTSAIFYHGCHVNNIANFGFLFKAVAAGDGIVGVYMTGCAINSTGNHGIDAQGVNHLIISQSNFQVGGAKYAVVLESEGGGGVPCANVRIDPFTVDMTGTLGILQVSVSTGTNRLTDASGNILGPVTLRNLAGANNNFTVNDAGDVIIERGPLKMLAAASQIYPGATSLTFFNNAGSQNNLVITDAGVVTHRSDLVLGTAPRILTTGTVPTVGSGGTGTSALSIITGSTNTAGQFQVTLTAIAPGVVCGVVAFGGGALATAPKHVVCSLSAPTAGVASPPIVGADTYTTSGFTIRSYGPTTVTTGTYIITFHCFF